MERKRIYYIPGIISLTILPFAFISYAAREIKGQICWAIPIHLTDENLPKKYPELFTQFNGRFLPQRNYLDITFTGNNQNDEAKLNFAQLRIREILSQNDSVTGVHFKFSDSSEYWTVVKAIDILRIENAKTYVQLDGDIWFLHFPPEKTINSAADNCFLCNDVITVEPKISWWTKTSHWIKHMWGNSWKLILIFTAFLISIFIIKRQNNSI